MRTIALIKGPTDDGNMPNLLAAVSVAGIILAVLMVRLKKASKRERRWMPDIRRIT
jgi:hypothetical protein